jgi:hypothetical protein
VKRFAFIDAWKKVWSIEQMCRVLKVTSRGFRAWRSRPMGTRQRKDLEILAHIREQHSLALGSYGRPRMTEELKELGLAVGHRRVGRLMRQNDIRVVRTRKFKATTDSNHRFNIAPNLLDRDFSASAPNQKWAGDISFDGKMIHWIIFFTRLTLDPRGMALSGRHSRSIFEALNRLGGQQPDEERPCYSCTGYGDQSASAATRMYSPYRPRQPILQP